MSVGPDDDRLDRIERMLQQLLDIFSAMADEPGEPEPDLDVGYDDVGEMGTYSPGVDNLEDYRTYRQMAALNEEYANPYPHIDMIPDEELEGLLEATEYDISPENMERYHFYALTFLSNIDSLDSIYHHLSDAEFARFVREAFILSIGYDPEYADIVRTAAPGTGFFGIGYDETRERVAVQTFRLKLLLLRSHGSYWWTFNPGGLSGGPYDLPINDFRDQTGVEPGYISPATSLGLPVAEEPRFVYGNQDYIDTLSDLVSIVESKGRFDELNDETIQFIEATDLV